MHHLPRADGDSRYVYPIGTKVRKKLDHPKGTTGEKLFGKFRATDYRWDQKISTVTSAKSVLLLTASMLFTFSTFPDAAALVIIAVAEVVASWCADLAIQTVAVNILGAAMITLQKID